MHLNPNELTIVYNQENDRDKKTLSYAYTITDRINKQELGSVKVSSTLFQILVKKLNLDPKMLINKADPYYQKNIRGKNFSIKEWFDVIMNRPNLLKAPLAMYHDKAIVCNTPTDILRLT